MAGPLGRLYGRYVLPRLVNLSCGVEPVRRQRAKVLPRASGDVLEVGFGTGLNLPWYDAARVSKLWAVEPSPAMWARARERVQAAPFPVEAVLASAEEIPLDIASADTVVVTYSLCSIADVARALREMRRVLKPSGELLFCEHGAAPDPGVRRWQERLDRIWPRLAGGCHLGREIPVLIEQAGFAVRELSSMYLPGPKPMTFNYWGSARPVAGTTGRPSASRPPTTPPQ